MKFSHLRTQGFTSTRSRLGLSQRQLAQQLGISKASIGMAETGRRNLPVSALLKLAELEIRSAGARISATPATVETNTDQSEQDTCFKIRELQCDLQIQKFSKLLKTMETQYKSFQTQLRLVDGIIESESGEPGNIMTLYLSVHRERIHKQLERCNPMQQILLRNKIALLAAGSHLNRSVRQLIG